nr:glycosyltransferase [Luteimonas sp. MC1825]
MLEPLGQSQVLTYLERLATTREIHLLSFEKPEDWVDVSQRENVLRRMKAAGIHWHPRRYHKRPSALATAWDIGMGTVSGLWLVVRHRIDIVHARSYVPAVMALLLQKLVGVDFLFDMRGFWADERVDGELWPRSGRMFRVAKWFERRFLLEADHVVSLTQAAVGEMAKFEYLAEVMPPVTVIPTCADLDRFRPQTGRRDPHRFVLGYVGSAGTWYQFDAVVECFRQFLALRPEGRILIINRNEHAAIRSQMDAAGIPRDTYELRSASHQEVPGQMARMDAGVFFIKPLFSKQASAPTKLGEFLGCGIPCLANRGVGDMADLLEGEQVGVAVTGFDPDSIRVGLEEILRISVLPGIQERCVEAARRHFSLEAGVAAYQDIYARLEGRDK